MKLISQITLNFFLLTFALLSWADEPNFETSSADIIKQLSKPVTKVKFRSLNSNKNPKIQPEKLTRGLIRVKLADPAANLGTRKMIEERADVPMQESQAHVNLKVEFDAGSFIIRASSYGVLNELSTALQDPKLLQLQFYVNGHTDSDGEQHANLKLSLNRALAVKQYLIEHSQIAPERLSVLGYGESIPLVNNVNAYNKQLNRRVEIVVK